MWNNYFETGVVVVKHGGVVVMVVKHHGTVILVVKHGVTTIVGLKNGGTGRAAHLHTVINNIAVDVHGAGLAHAVNTRDSLLLEGRLQAGVQQMHVIGCTPTTMSVC